MLIFFNMVVNYFLVAFTELMGICWNDIIVGLKSIKFFNVLGIYYIDVNSIVKSLWLDYI